MKDGAKQRAQGDTDIHRDGRQHVCRLVLRRELASWELWLKGEPDAAADEAGNEDVRVSRPISKAVGASRIMGLATGSIYGPGAAGNHSYFSGEQGM